MARRDDREYWVIYLSKEQRSQRGSIARHHGLLNRLGMEVAYRSNDYLRMNTENSSLGLTKAPTSVIPEVGG
jgi:hypothetical protein